MPVPLKMFLPLKMPVPIKAITLRMPSILRQKEKTEFCDFAIPVNRQFFGCCSYCRRGVTLGSSIKGVGEEGGWSAAICDRRLSISGAGVRFRRGGAGAGGGGDAFGEDAQSLAVEPQQHADGELEGVGDRPADVIGRVLPEHVELAGERPNVGKPREHQDLFEAVLGDAVEVVDVVREVLGGGQRVAAVDGVDQDPGLGPVGQGLSAEGEEVDGFLEGEMVELLLGDDKVQLAAEVLEEGDGFAEFAGQVVLLGVLDVAGAGVDALDVGVAGLDQGVDEVAGPAAEHGDAGAAVPGDVGQVVSAVIGFESAVAGVEVFKVLAVGFEGLDPRGPLLPRPDVARLLREFEQLFDAGANGAWAREVVHGVGRKPGLGHGVGGRAGGWIEKTRKGAVAVLTNGLVPQGDKRKGGGGNGRDRGCASLGSRCETVTAWTRTELMSEMKCRKDLVAERSGRPGWR